MFGYANTKQANTGDIGGSLFLRLFSWQNYFSALSVCNRHSGKFVPLHEWVERTVGDFAQVHEGKGNGESEDQ